MRRPGGLSGRSRRLSGSPELLNVAKRQGCHPSSGSRFARTSGHVGDPAMKHDWSITTPSVTTGMATVAIVVAACRACGTMRAFQGPRIGTKNQKVDLTGACPGGEPVEPMAIRG